MSPDGVAVLGGRGHSAAEAVLGAGRSLAGSVMGVALVPALLLALIAAPVSRAPAATVSRWQARRLAWIEGVPPSAQPSGGRLLGLLAIEALLGLLAACVLALVVAGVVVAVETVLGAATGRAVTIFGADPGAVTWATVARYALPGALLVFLAASGLVGIARLDRSAWATLARPGVGELTQEVSRLHTTLDDVIAAVDAERRRIERDIHDGVQQRVVALSIILARVERTGDPAVRADLQRRARAEAQQILDELRGVAWRTYPAMLVRDGLAAALEVLRDRTPVPASLRVSVPGRTNHAAEAAAYFVASEAVTNAIKHADASQVHIDVARLGADLVVTVRDDGKGGADPGGLGLSGIASRVAARGGRLSVDSPRGGPTTIKAVIPCE
ncbi:sensor histidine kinase [Georgenia faecalis]|uniref:sensor histidine kinase n=1 Tax=Georgenia faecalis TaxID=2483799 RepID=UPI0013DE7C94|nr:ATP-binding protein [Georgenia faecalis]